VLLVGRFRILELIHLDVYGSMSSASLSSNIYYVSFTNASSRKSWIYFMKTKDEVFEKFQEFKALVENQTGKKIKLLRSSHGGSIPQRSLTLFARKQESRRS
jgi:hypothetical protein